MEKNLKNFTENEFLSKKEKWYKTKYAEYKLDYDHIWHMFRRRLKNSELAYPKFGEGKLKLNENDSLCVNKHGKKIKKKECKKLFALDKTITIP